MNRIRETLKDTDYLVRLLNGPCSPEDDGHICLPIRREWIDEEASAVVTEALNRLLPDGIPYLNYVLAERNPDTACNGTCVDSPDKRQRYFVVTVVPDTDHPFDVNLPLFHQLRIIGLHCWEVIRAVLAANREDTAVALAMEPKPPILNNARIEWVTLYLGRKPYDGLTRLSQQWKSMEEFDGYETDIHLFKLREMSADPLLQCLIDAYDTDFPQPSGGEVDSNGSTEV